MGLKKLVVDALALKNAGIVKSPKDGIKRFYRRRSAPLGAGVLQAQNP